MANPTMIPTPHISAKEGDFAKTVLMPGDPLRAKYYAEIFLENPRLVNGVRNMLAYTGTYKGVPVSVMGSGMGMPSIGIYSHELYNFYGVENIIRLGTTGSIQPYLKVGDLVLAQGACAASLFESKYHLIGNFAPIADFGLLMTAYQKAEKLGLKVYVGNVLSEDFFYSDGEMAEMYGKLGVLSLEMEAAALYMEALEAGKRAAAILTVSDEVLTGEAMDSDKRERSLADMGRIALETALEYA